MSDFKIRTARGVIYPVSVPESRVEVSEESVLMSISSPIGNHLGIQMNTDGTFTLGTWDRNGVWIELLTMARNNFGQRFEMPLNAYEGELL